MAGDHQIDGHQVDYAVFGQQTDVLVLLDLLRGVVEVSHGDAPSA
ncbi:hypothetical protein [Nonomuraea dietziae]|uniref:Uncharacterized protein n=1 Tax=Nonomuraea dietziae TaxID=65515 RepID=A0A7W5VDT4_9ACTN|nr:hypothetical protein [Nonomuraea dietziae]MBB3730065.1 hypothetical protein [Nonomuraea dietziae]